MPFVHVDLNIAAPIEEIWRAINDIEAYPEFMEDVQNIVVTSCPSQAERVSAWSVLLKGSVLEWTERETINREAFRIEFQQLDGDLDLFCGHWQLTASDAAVVQVELSVEFEIGIPLLAEMLNPVASRALEQNSARMLREIERRVAEVESTFERQTADP